MISEVCTLAPEQHNKSLRKHDASRDPDARLSATVARARENDPSAGRLLSFQRGIMTSLRAVLDERRMFRSGLPAQFKV